MGGVVNRTFAYEVITKGGGMIDRTLSYDVLIEGGGHYG